MKGRDIKEEIEWNTHWSQRYYKQQKVALENYENDVDKERRISNRQCKTCQYLRNGLAGQAFTDYNCSHCNQAGCHPNTAVPKYCKTCSTEFDICANCGSEMKS